MNNHSKQVLFIGIGLVVLITVGAYFFFLYKKTHSGVALQCGAITITLSPAFSSLAHPSHLPTLDQHGCYQASDGCSCAKVGANGKGIVLGISKANTAGIAIPADIPGQEQFLTNLGAYLKGNLATTTLMTVTSGTYLTNPSITLKAVTTGSLSPMQSETIYFIHNGLLTSIVFQTDTENFKAYWPDINNSLLSAAFIK